MIREYLIVVLLAGLFTSLCACHSEPLPPRVGEADESSSQGDDDSISSDIQSHVEGQDQYQGNDPGDDPLAQQS